MPSIRLFESPEIDIEYDEDNKWLYVNWKGFQLVQSVKDGCEKMLEFVKEYKCEKVLNDNTLVKGIWAGAAEWGATNWFPRMKNAGVKQFAWIYSPSFFSKMSTDLTLDVASPQLLEGEFIKTFFSREDAENWLKN
ncbi:MAG: hypothetical protein V4642_08515 [Bacteroidota bacterium]